MDLGTTKMIARKEGGIGWMIFNQPEKHNAIVLRDVAGHARRSSPNSRPTRRCASSCLTGAGEKAFVSGADISEFENKRSAEENIKIYDAAGEAAQARADRMPTSPRIAMIRGICIGGGLAIALNTDVRICSANSVFAVPAARLGLGYKYPGIKRLVDIVGPAFAKEIFFTAGKFTAEDARIMGLVNRVVPEPELEGYVAHLRCHHRRQRAAHGQGRQDGDQCGRGGPRAAPAWPKSMRPSRPALPARTTSRAAAPSWKSASRSSRDAERPRQSRPALAAGIQRPRTMAAWPRWRRIRASHGSVHLRARLPGPARHGGEQRLRVGVLRPRENIGRAALLDDDAVLHDGDLLAHVRGDAQVVRDEQHRQVEGGAQLVQQVEHLLLHRHVERRHRLVGDDQLRLHGERAGDADALALAAGELVRIAVRGLGVEADQPQQLARLVQRGLARRAVDDGPLGDDVADAPARIERGERVLEHHLQRLAIGAQLGARQAGDVARPRAQWRRCRRVPARRCSAPSVDLPEPDSPTSASERPFGTSRLTPATACTRCRPNDERAAAPGDSSSPGPRS